MSSPPLVELEEAEDAFKKMNDEEKRHAIEKWNESRHGTPLEDRVTWSILEDSGTLARHPDIDLFWTRRYEFVPFLPEDNHENAPEATVELMLEDLESLLRAPYHVFWSQVIFDSSLDLFLTSYLKFARRDFFEARFSVQKGQFHQTQYRETMRDRPTSSTLEKLRLFVLLVLCRMGTYKESANDFMSIEFFQETLQKHQLFPFSRLLDIASLYLPYSKSLPLVKKLVASVLSTQQPEIEETISSSMDESAMDMFHRAQEVLNVTEQLRELPKSSHDRITAGKRAIFNHVKDISKCVEAWFSIISLVPSVAYVVEQRGILLALATVYESCVPLLFDPVLEFPLDIAREVQYSILRLAMTVLRLTYLESITKVEFGNIYNLTTASPEKLVETEWTTSEAVDKLLSFLTEIDTSMLVFTEDVRKLQQSVLNRSNSFKGAFIHHLDARYDLVGLVKILKEEDGVLSSSRAKNLTGRILEGRRKGKSLYRDFDDIAFSSRKFRFSRRKPLVSNVEEKGRETQQEQEAVDDDAEHLSHLKLEPGFENDGGWDNILQNRGSRTDDEVESMVHNVKALLPDHALGALWLALHLWNFNVELTVGNIFDQQLPAFISQHGSQLDIPSAKALLDLVAQKRQSKSGGASVAAKTTSKPKAKERPSSMSMEPEVSEDAKNIVLTALKHKTERLKEATSQSRLSLEKYDDRIFDLDEHGDIRLHEKPSANMDLYDDELDDSYNAYFDADVGDETEEGLGEMPNIVEQTPKPSSQSSRRRDNDTVSEVSDSSKRSSSRERRGGRGRRGGGRGGGRDGGPHRGRGTSARGGTRGSAYVNQERKKRSTRKNAI